MVCPRIYVCFDIEDRQKYVERLIYAKNQRIIADSLIRKKYYIENMPTSHLSELSNE